MTPQRLFLFDLDDTLFDGEHSHRIGLTGLRDTYRQLTSIPLDELCAEYERQLQATYDSVLEGKASLVDSRTERFRRLFLHFEVAFEPAALADAVKLYRDGYERSRRPVPGSLALLKYLKLRGRVGVLSNGLVQTQSEKVAVCGMEPLVDFVLTSEEAGAKKPDKRIFLAALAKVGAVPQQAVFIGDSWGTDIVGAFGAGIRAVWFNRRQELCPDQSIATELMAYEPLDTAVRAINPEP